MPEFDRRNFLKLVGLGASGAASGCYRYSDLPEKLIPYVVQPEEITPGLPVTYASTCQECEAGCGLHVRTREGRAIKLEGNSDHPINRGALCARGQAGIGRTYHPDRYRGPAGRSADGAAATVSWEEGISQLSQKVSAAGQRTWVLGAPVGPTLSGLIDRWISVVGAGGRVIYQPFAQESLRAATEAVFGRRTQPVFDLSGTDYVIDFGADVMGTWLSPVEHQRQLKQARDINKPAGAKARLVSVGPRLDTTVASSDEWLPARPGSEGILAMGLARVAFEARSGAGKPVGGDPELIEGLLRGFDLASVAQRTEVPEETIRRIGRDLGRAERPAALPPGLALTGDKATASAGAVMLLNAVIGAIGASVSVPDADTADVPAEQSELQAFVERMQRGEVSVLVIHGSNPVYSLPGFAEALEKVDFVVSTASLADETSERAHLLLPDHTALESWGDASPRAGVRSIVQPSMRPLFDTQAFGDTLLAAGRALAAGSFQEGSFRQYVEAAWIGENWNTALQNGGVFSSAGARGAELSSGAAQLAVGEPTLAGDGSHVLMANPSPLLGDGSGANLPWLQETPDPVTKIAWQSWAEVSNATAESLGVEDGDVISVETPAGTAEIPVFRRGGIRDDVVAIATGQGHSVGHYASAAGDGRPGEARGTNVLALLPAAQTESGGRAWLCARASLAKTGAHRRLANTQRVDNKRGRQLGEAISLAAFNRGDWNASAHAPLTGSHGEAGHAGGNAEVGILAAPAHPAEAGAHGESAAESGAGHEAGHGEAHEILRPFDAGQDATGETPYRWGMTIDLDRCNGCSACVVACSIENNIPNVGEEGVLRSRQMSWLRIERFVTDGEPTLQAGRPAPVSNEKLGNTDVRHSPMLCQQCGAAPCEPVCPVFATYHNPEGLNAMIYNRCIGTRYCSNNCPYKVRRYNWFDYAIERWPEPMKYMLNPDVTVRGQGVMEKCTFCVQRIQSARQLAKDARRGIADGEVVPACAQTCPSEAIVFGNVRDDGTLAARRATENQGRAYHALHVLNTRPGITYLAKVNRHGDEESHG